MDLTRIAYVTAALVVVVLWIAVAGAAIYLFTLIVRALKKYISSREVREEKAQIKRSLSEVLRENRIRCKMTQEFVSEAIGVSRQAVSKWEKGASDPATSNLIALAHLYGISPEELLRSVAPCPPQQSETEGKKEGL